MYDIVPANNNTPAVANATTEMMVSRQAQEVQAAMVVAKRFPRNEDTAISRILRACKRPSLASRAMYEYPRGGEKVTGPSIRLAESIAQNWGNIDFGLMELEQKNGESTVMAYCWDLETNTRETKVFTVPHIRSTRKGSVALTDPRDIYELVANQGARRLRSCILGIIPGDIVDAAVAECEKTLNAEKDLPQRIANTVKAYEALGVPVEELERVIGCKVEAFTVQAVVRLGKMYNAISEGRSDVSQFFDAKAIKAAAEVAALPDAQAVDPTTPASTVNGGQVKLSDL